MGYAQPGEFGDLIRHLLTTVKGADKVTFAVHCHNDLGLAVANTLSALAAGARQAEVTLCGIGERAGNASLEQVVMGLHTRPGYYNLTTGIVTEEIFPSCRRLSGIIGQPIPPYAPVIGRNAFAHESGIHQHGIMKDRRTYEIMTAEHIGRKGAVVVLGKHSGRHALDAKVKELGYTLSDDELKLVFDAVKQLADRKQQILDDDIEALILEKALRRPDHYAVEFLSVHCGNVELAPSAVVQLMVEGNRVRQYASGSGPVDAAFNAVCQAVGRKPHLEEFSINAITGGTDAQGEVTVRVRDGEATTVGRGVHDDVHHGQHHGLHQRPQPPGQKGGRPDMPATLAEKILQRHCDAQVTGPGQIVRCRLSLVLANDITAPLGINAFRQMGAEAVFDRDKVVIVADHFTPNKDIASAEQVKICREFAREQGLTHYYEGGNVGVEHALLPELGPGRARATWSSAPIPIPAPTAGSAPSPPAWAPPTSPAAWPWARPGSRSRRPSRSY